MLTYLELCPAFLLYLPLTNSSKLSMLEGHASQLVVGSTFQTWSINCGITVHRFFSGLPPHCTTHFTHSEQPNIVLQHFVVATSGTIGTVWHIRHLKVSPYGTLQTKWDLCILRQRGHFVQGVLDGCLFLEFQLLL